ncbi:NAD(P)/FAD-dependent oxidoreductase [Longivirga aurantiaca]|uniref:NAD(P)/FAD-dependent oxidoreductase n=1 Tax=Longivirga aurantiaca TaxID=1837743 RepID=A0ABW1SZR0_9ACTN
MRVVVVGAGAWGLPAAAELARRGHQVVLLDRHGAAGQLGSSSGPTRLWRLSHPDRLRVRLAQRSVQAWERLEQDSGITAILRRGLLWRDDVSVPLVADALAAEGVPHTVVEPGDVASFFPGLRADGRHAVWQETAGPVLARAALDAQAGLFAMAGGRIVVGPVVREVDTSGDDVVLRYADHREIRADRVVLAPGAGAGRLLEALGIDVAMSPVLEQVCHVGHPGATDDLPCLYDGPLGDEPGMYAMPTPGRGYKLGIDQPLRAWREDDIDRVPSPEVSAHISERVRRNFAVLDPTVLDAQVCTWTDSPDGRFVIDVVRDGRVVIACGDSGEGFKFSALMGLVLADLAEGSDADQDVAAFSLARFADGSGAASPDGHVLGR